MAKVSIFLKDPFVEKFIREEKITVVSFFGSIGGTLGLLFGFSVISIFEIVYLLIVFLSNNVIKESRALVSASGSAKILTIKECIQ